MEEIEEIAKILNNHIIIRQDDVPYIGEKGILKAFNSLTKKIDKLKEENKELEYKLDDAKESYQTFTAVKDRENTQLKERVKELEELNNMGV